MNADAADRPIRNEPLHLGSEYADARTFLDRSTSREVRGDTRDAASVRRRPSQAQPQHGSNDSDFGIPDQAAD